MIIAITGASAGIGAATARLAAREGASVVVQARRADRLASLVAGIEAAGGRALAVAGDVAVEADARAVVDRAVERFGRLDVMVCNAGIGFHGPLDDTPAEAMRRLVDVNLLGTLYGARAALEVFRRQGRGHLIVVSSVVAVRGVAGSGLYAATKAGQFALVESLRAEFAGTGIHASVVCPVRTETEFREAEQRDFGRRVEGHGPVQAADAVARAILRCVHRPVPVVYPYRPAWLLAVLTAVAPAISDRVARRFGRRADPAPDR